MPEAYEPFKMPDGVQLDAEVATELQTVAKEFRLSQDEAQKVSDLGVKMIQKLAAQQKESFAKVQQQWAEASKTDKEFGGDKFDENKAVAEKALNQFGTPELFTLLDESGLRKHPEIIRLLYKAGKAISDDRVLPGSTRPNQGGVDAAKVLYPNSSN